VTITSAAHALRERIKTRAASYKYATSIMHYFPYNVAG